MQMKKEKRKRHTEHACIILYRKLVLVSGTGMISDCKRNATVGEHPYLHTDTSL